VPNRLLRCEGRSIGSAAVAGLCKSYAGRFVRPRRSQPHDTASGDTMNDHRSPLFCDTALAARIERAEVELVAKASEAAGRRTANAASFVIPIGGGVASFAEAGSPFNKVAGLGFGPAPGTTELDGIEQAFTARGAPTQIELAHLADPGIGALLTGRGYRLVSFENVLGRALGAEPEPIAPNGIEVRASGDDEFDRWLDVAYLQQVL